MKNNVKYFLAALAALCLSFYSVAQSMEKKYHTVHVEIPINASADRVWEAMVLDYGEISNFSPYIYTSSYINGSLKGERGAQRTCNFNEKGTQWVQEQIVSIDQENKVMINRVVKGKKVPLNPDNSRAFYRVKDNGDGTSTASYEFQFRTSPAIMGMMAKGAFKKQLSGTLIGLKHYVETGEIVRGGNGKYQEIKDDYPKPTVVSSN